MQRKDGAAGRADRGARQDRAGVSGPLLASREPATFVRQVELRRGKTTRVKLRLKPRFVRSLIKQAPRKARAVAVRLAVSFDAEPRPIVRFVDFPIKIKQKKPKR